MILKHPGKAKYPYPKSKNMVAIIGYCISTILFWLMIIIIPIRSISTQSDLYNSQIFLESIQPLLRLIGMIIMSIGLIVGILGRWARGVYNAHNTTKLQTRLGFAIVRHPNYFQYMCGFLGIPLITLHFGTLVLPMIGIYGYYIIAKEEENRLIVEFGDEYRQYMRKVGMYFPKISFSTQEEPQYSRPIVVKNLNLPVRKIIGSPFLKHPKNKSGWLENIATNVNQYFLSQKEREIYPQHPYYSSDENSETSYYQYYAQTMR